MDEVKPDAPKPEEPKPEEPKAEIINPADWKPEDFKPSDFTPSSPPLPPKAPAVSPKTDEPKAPEPPALPQKVLLNKFDLETLIVLLLRLLSSIPNLSLPASESHLLLEIKDMLSWSSSGCLPSSTPQDKELDWFESWESIIDKEQRHYNLYYCPQEFSSNPKLLECELNQRKVSCKIADLAPIANEDPKLYSLPACNYVDSLPAGNPKYNDFKMLKHWEKHIIPRIQDCLRAELSKFEFEDFFEQ